MRELIGFGSSAEVWALDADRALKLYYPQVAAESVERELTASRIAHAAGLRVAEPMFRTAEAGRDGIVFERIEGTLLLRRILLAPHSMWSGMPRMAAYQREMHRCLAGNTLPTVHEVVRDSLPFSQAGSTAQAKAQQALERLPTGDRLGHGDFHPGNVILSDGGLVAVDWSNAWAGPPAADAARTELLIRYGLAGAREVAKVPSVARAISAWWYRRSYQRVTGVSAAEIDAWRLPLAVAWYRGQSFLRDKGLLADIFKWCGH